MTLTDHELVPLIDAIQGYAFPAVTYDFEAGREVMHPHMRDVEEAIYEALVSTDTQCIRNGLANVLYWGYARMGMRDVRVRRFRENVTERNLSEAREVFSDIAGPGLRTLAGIRLPEFSQVSFLSKVRMFLDPRLYVTLDLKLAKLQNEADRTVLHDLTVRKTSIPVTQHNEKVYADWCEQCQRLALKLGTEHSLRAVDVERGFFHLVEQGKAKVAAGILTSHFSVTRSKSQTSY